VRELQREAERLRNLDELRGREDVITEPESDEIRSVFRSTGPASSSTA
jgi:hypothetical protein